MSKEKPGLGLQFDFLFHHPNPWIDDLLHGDHTHTDDDGNEVISPGTPDRPVVIDPEPDPAPANPNPAPNPNPGPTPELSDEPQTRTGDLLIGGSGNDALTADGGGDYNLLDGKGGDDTLTAAGGSHVVMIGGPGNDVFDVSPVETYQDHLGNHFTRSAFSGTAFIMDFEDGRDKIKIGDDDWRDGIKDFFNASREAGLTFDMDWIAADTGADVLLEIDDGHREILIKDVNMGELQLMVMDGDLFIV